MPTKKSNDNNKRQGSGESAGRDADVDAIDGCDVDITDATPDEDLPPTEGGVA